MRVCYLTAAVVMLSLRLVMAGPDIAATVPADGAVVSALTSLRVTFSEPVTGVNATDLGVNGNPAAGVTGSGAGPYVFTFPQPPAGTVSFSWDVDQSIAGLGTGEFVPAGSITVTLTDNLPPQLAKLATSVPGQEMDDVQPSPGSAAGMIRQAVVNFSEEVSGVDAADLLVNGVAAAVVTGSAAGPYVFQFEAVAEGGAHPGEQFRRGALGLGALPARREERDARGLGGARGGQRGRTPRPNNNRSNGGQSRDGQSRDQYIRNERMADNRRATAPRGPQFDPLASEDREARAAATPRRDDRPARPARPDQRGGDFRRDRSERDERAERPVKLHRDAVRPVGQAPRGDKPQGAQQGGQQQRRKPAGKKPNGTQRRWG